MGGTGPANRNRSALRPGANSGSAKGSRGPSRARQPAASGRQANAFTLVELLVVIGILALLVTILSPVIVRTRVAAKRSLCSKNLRTLQVGMTLYAAANGMRLSGLDWGTGWRMSWVADDYWEIWWGAQGRHNIERGLIWPYVKQYGPYLCPTFEEVCRRPPSGAEWRPGVPYAQGYSGWGGHVPSIDLDTFDPVRSYSLNEYIMDKTTAFNLDMSGRVWLCDENPWRNLYLQGDLGGWDPAYGINNGHLGWSDAPAEYHDGQTNCVFGDGHVEQWTPVAVHANLSP